MNIVNECNEWRFRWDVTWQDILFLCKAVGMDGNLFVVGYPNNCKTPQNWLQDILEISMGTQSYHMIFERARTHIEGEQSESPAGGLAQLPKAASVQIHITKMICQCVCSFARISPEPLNL